jgi:hypothetical protein
MRIPFLRVLFFLFVTGCTNASQQNSKETHSPSEPTITEAKKDSFFPVTSFLKGQMIVLDSLPVTPLHTITMNNKTDSVWIKKGVLSSSLSVFLTPEIKENNLTEYFRETSFNDQTLDAITFTYDPVKKLPDSISLRHWDIYIDPETGKILKVYIVKEFKEKEKTIMQQLTWKTNSSAAINTLINTPGGKIQLQKAEKFIWNFNQ